MIDYDSELQFHNRQLRQAYQIESADQVLDVGCGTGQTTREAARLASDGVVTGVDVDEEMIARARESAYIQGIDNVRFEVGDVARFPFRRGEFDVAISRFGTMFFTDPPASFRNIAHAIRPEGRLVMMVWQSYERNEWAVAIDRALGREAAGPIATATMNPFSLAEPPTVQRLLSGAGFDSIILTEVDVPVYYGRDADAAFDSSASSSQSTTPSRGLTRRARRSARVCIPRWRRTPRMKVSFSTPGLGLSQRVDDDS